MQIGIHGMKTVLRKDEIMTKQLSELFEMVLWGRNCGGPNLGTLL